MCEGGVFRDGAECEGVVVGVGESEATRPK